MSVPERMFVSGHSLTNEPVPSFVAAIAQGFGLTLAWDRQHLDGSSIKQRTRGSAVGTAPWNGYAQGVNRVNAPMDVIAEFRRAKDAPYDTLLITEQHFLLGSLVWNDTISHLADFQKHFTAHNTAGTTYFYEPWLSLDDKSHPERWITYERAAAPVWQCVIEQMNRAARAHGRPGAIVSLPAASALAYLIEQATAHPGLEGITQQSVRATVDALVDDDVHLTPLGNYYMALVTFRFTFGRPVKDAWYPQEITELQARTLQRTVEAFAQVPRAAPLPLDACRSYVRRSFLWTYLAYADRTSWRKERGYLGGLYMRLKLALQWSILFSRETPENPFAEAAYGAR